jgi:hypothetical protein
MSNRLGGKQYPAYLGTNASQPPNWSFENRAPTTHDINYSIGDMWMDSTTNIAWLLISLKASGSSGGRSVATWIPFSNNSFFIAHNTVLGYEALNSLTTGDYNTAIGYQSLTSCREGNGNTALGSSAGYALDAGSYNTVIGYESGTSMVNSQNNVTIGYRAGILLTGGDYNVLIGNFAGANYAANEDSNIVIGSQVGVPTEEGIVRIGNEEASNNENTFIGNYAGNSTYTLATPPGNTFCGYYCGRAVTTGKYNCGHGDQVFLSLTEGNSNCGFGYKTLDAITTGSENTAYGTEVLSQVVTGSDNIGIGFKAGDAYTTSESSNICIGNVGVVTAPAESNTIRLGTHGAGAAQQNRCFIAGIRGITPDSTNILPVIIDANGQLGTSSKLTWIPDLKFGGANTGITYSLKEAYYITFGDLVFFWTYMALTSKGTAAGLATITGLPFSAVNYMPLTIKTNFVTFNDFLCARIYSNIIDIQQIDSASGAGSWLTDANFINTSNLIISGIIFRA